MVHEVRSRSSSSKLAREVRSRAPAAKLQLFSVKGAHEVLSHGTRLATFKPKVVRNMHSRSSGCKIANGYVQRWRAQRAPAASARKSQLSSAKVFFGKCALASPARKTRNFKTEKQQANYTSVSAARESQRVSAHVLCEVHFRS